MQSLSAQYCQHSNLHDGALANAPYGICRYVCKYHRIMAIHSGSALVIQSRNL